MIKISHEQMGNYLKHKTKLDCFLNANSAVIKLYFSFSKGVKGFDLELAKNKLESKVLG